ncbi:MAG: peptidase M19 [Marinilabiliales bacterium]|nr:MAG: peptidase M19 [Marinilabiliales bacterium]
MKKYLKNIRNTLSIRKLSIIIVTTFLIYLTPSCNTPDKSNEVLLAQAQQISKEILILDSHIDWPSRLLDEPEDISQEITQGDFDMVRVNKGGFDAALSVIYASPDSGVDENRAYVDSQLNMVVGYANRYPDQFALAKNPNDILQNFKQNLFSIPLCLENGAPIGDDLSYLKYLKEKGFAYITITHSKSNQISDSNFDTNRIWQGLSPFGLEVIKEMNRLGIMIDISHSTDSAVFQAVRHSKAPIIASHSSCRYFVQGYERNLSDTLIKAIAHKSGVVMVSLASSFLDSLCHQNWNYIFNWYDSTGISYHSEEGVEFALKYGETHPLKSNAKKLADHIDHIVQIAGIDHVGIGTDYDGIGPLLQPADMPDVSSYPVLVAELLKRGYTKEEIEKIMSGNFLRVWHEVLEISDSMNNSSVY